MQTNSAIDTRLGELRRMLAEKFPGTEQKPGGIFPTGMVSVDSLEGGLRRAALTEFSGTNALFLHALLGSVCREKCFAALVDGARTFDPGDCAPTTLARLLVVFCADAMQAVKAADLLLRDGNFSLMMLDLQHVPLAQLRRIPSNTWHRLQRLVEQTTAAFVVLTPEPFVEAAQVRIAGSENFPLAVQRRWRRDIFAETQWHVFPRRAALTA